MEMAVWYIRERFRMNSGKGAHPSNYGLRMPDLEVCCSHPRPKAAGVAIQVSSHCD
jgi:hypothetical protein